MPVPEAEEDPRDAVHAAAAEEVHPGLGGDVQGGPPRSAPAEPPAGPVYAASGAHDEPPGKDDPTFQHLISTTSKALKFCSYCLVFPSIKKQLNIKLFFSTCFIPKSVGPGFRNGRLLPADGNNHGEL